LVQMLLIHLTTIGMVVSTKLVLLIMPKSKIS
jgi:hypothetical protein